MLDVLGLETELSKGVQDNSLRKLGEWSDSRWYSTQESYSWFSLYHKTDGMSEIQFTPLALLNTDTKLSKRHTCSERTDKTS